MGSLTSRPKAPEQPKEASTTAFKSLEIAQEFCNEALLMTKAYGLRRNEAIEALSFVAACLEIQQAKKKAKQKV